MQVNDSRLLNLCDGKLQTDDGCTFKIHRIILARKSEYFYSMFCGINKDKRVFTISGISGRCLGEILKYIDTDEICVTEENVAELLEAGNYLLMTDLYLQIKRSFVKFLTNSNCLRVLNIANLIDDQDIARETFRYTETKFERIRNTHNNGLTELTLELLEKILRSVSLYVYSETTVWLSIVEWTQKDMSARLRYVPQLLRSLATQELDEELATEILWHDIVSGNVFMEDLNVVKESRDFTSDLDTLLYFLENDSSFTKITPAYRIPSHVHVISSYIENGEDPPGRIELHVTYDENLDLCRKIGVRSYFYNVFLTVVGCKLFLFEMKSKRFEQFDLLTQQWIPMRHVCRSYSVVIIERFIYILGELRHIRKFGMEVYSVSNERWVHSASLTSIRKGASVTLNQKIYVVGNTGNFLEMATQMFDPETKKWTALSPPNVYRKKFALVAYRQKVYAIGGYNGRNALKSVEVYDPVTNLWHHLPHLPSTYDSIIALVFEQQLFVYDYIYDMEEKSDIFRWNDVAGRWEGLEATGYSRNMKLHRFSIVDDVNAVRFLTKQSRDPRVYLEKCPCI